MEMETEDRKPRWVFKGLGVLLMVFVLLLIVQKAYDLNQTFKNQKPANTMTVSAEGKVEVVPDLATVSIGVVTDGKDETTVKNQNNEKINRIIAYVKQQGVDSKDIKTSQYYTQPQYDYRNGSTNIIGYQANQTITVKVHGIDKDQTKLETILSGVVDNGANSVYGQDLSVEDPDNARQEARKQAIEKAKQKAQELASEAGLTLGKVVSVSESGGYYPPVTYGAGMALDSAANQSKSVAPNIEPGTNEVTATMSVTFEVK